MPEAEPFERILDSFTDAVFKVDMDGRVTYANGAAIELIGADRDPRGSPLRDMLPPSVVRHLEEVGFDVSGRGGGNVSAKVDNKSTLEGLTTPTSDSPPHIRADGSTWDHDIRVYRSASEVAVHFRPRSKPNGGHPEGGADPSSHRPAPSSESAAHPQQSASSIPDEPNFRTLADATPQIVWTIGRDGSVLYLNDPGRNYFGVEGGSETFGWGAALHGDDRASVRAAWRRALETRSAFEDEFRLMRHDGVFRWHLGRALPVYGQDGEILHWCGTSTDIHDLKVVQTMLQEREQRFRTMADTAPVMIWMTDDSKEYTYVNKGWLDFTGKKLEGEGFEWPDRVHPEDVDRLVDAFDDAFAKREAFSLEYRLRRHDGEFRWVLDHGAPIIDTAGTFSGFIGSCIDIHERRQLEDQIRFLAEASPILNSSLDYESTMQSLARLMVPHMADWCAVDMLSPAGVLELVAVAHADPEKMSLGRRLRQRYPADVNAPRGLGRVVRTGRIELYPEITDEMLERSALDDEHLRIMRSIGFRSALILPLKARGQTLGAMTLVWSESNRRYTDSDLHFMEEVARRAATVVDNARLYRGAAVARTELERLNQTLEARVVERTDALRAANETLLEEVDERRRAQMETSRLNRLLKLRNRELQDFAHVASHDLQEPLRKILAFSSLLIDDYGQRIGDGRVYLERIENSAERMMKLIRDLLEFSRVATRGEAFRSVALKDLIRDVLSDLDLRLAETGGRVELDTKCSVVADPVQMRQLLLNLIGNALKFHRENEPPVVTVRSRSEDSVCILEVQDNGIGFDESYVERIFSPFQRLHERSMYPGTGMGLAICRRIVERHEGTITAHSSPGKGSTFVVRLPLEQQSAA